MNLTTSSRTPIAIPNTNPLVEKPSVAWMRQHKGNPNAATMSQRLSDGFWASMTLAIAEPRETKNIRMLARGNRSIPHISPTMSFGIVATRAAQTPVRTENPKAMNETLATIWIRAARAPTVVASSVLAARQFAVSRMAPMSARYRARSSGSRSLSGDSAI